MSTRCKVCGDMTSVSPTYHGTFVKCRVCLMQSTPASDKRNTTTTPMQWDEDTMRSFVDEFLGESEAAKKEMASCQKGKKNGFIEAT
jgi:hypothetical protein